MVLHVNCENLALVKRGFALCLTIATLTIFFELDLKASAQTELSRSQRQELKKRAKNSEKIIGDLEKNYIIRQEAHYKRQDRKTRKTMRKSLKQSIKQANRRSHPWFKRLIFRWKSRK
ncbi:MAG: hypothetical protein CL831_09485 [Crocinitomicaceae bacterium]|mgnify:CR=1 FL=1|nr:hypothetical protein [Crocinitomicaceae bacterium]